MDVSLAPYMSACLAGKECKYVDESVRDMPGSKMSERKKGARK